MTTIKLQKRWSDRIADISRDPDGCWFVGLKRGWYNPASETHQVVAMTLWEVARELADCVACSVETCKADDCGPFLLAHQEDHQEKALADAK